MAMVTLNDDMTAIGYPAATWGTLLDRIEAERAAVGEVITGVRLDGFRIPGFRSPEALSRPLAAHSQVGIESARPADLIRETLEEAESATPAIVEGAVALAASYRGPDVTAANQALPGFAESLGTLVVITNAVAQGAGVELAACGDGRQSAPELIDALITHTTTLLSAQAAGDWLQVADVIEYDIAASVERWPLVLQSIRDAAPALTRVA